MNKLQYYVAGQEDIRGGLTCTFRIHPKLPLFTFHLAGREDNTFGNLDITSGASPEVIQTIENSTDPNAIAPAKAESAITAVDANFDGYQDLQLLSFCSAKTCSYNFYLYDPKVNRFVLDKFLSGLSSPAFDPAKKQVSQGWLLSAYEGGSETYQYENDGQYTLIRKEATTWDRDAHTITQSTYELRNGQMELVDTKTTPE
ncbi:MAG: XAC2610-related protein [Candidatus Sulfotelmatobacter sp.]